MDRLTVENRQIAETAAIWQGRARVLTERLALPAPQQPLAASGAPNPPEPTTEPSPPPEPFPWPLPPQPNLRALAPWVLAVLAIAALAVLLVAGIPLTMPR